MSNILYMLYLIGLISCDLDNDWRSIDTAQEAKTVGISDITKLDEGKITCTLKQKSQTRSETKWRLDILDETHKMCHGKKGLSLKA